MPGPEQGTLFLPSSTFPAWQRTAGSHPPGTECGWRGSWAGPWRGAGLSLWALCPALQPLSARGAIPLEEDPLALHVLLLWQCPLHVPCRVSLMDSGPSPGGGLDGSALSGHPPHPQSPAVPETHPEHVCRVPGGGGVTLGSAVVLEPALWCGSPFGPHLSLGAGSLGSAGLWHAGENNSWIGPFLPSER